MEIVYNVVVVSHLLGMAAVVGGYAADRSAVNEVMVWGARAQLISGVVLVGMVESISSLDKDLDMVKLGVKLVIALLVAACAEMGRADAKRGKDPAWMPHAAGGLAIVNVLIATLWT